MATQATQKKQAVNLLTAAREDMKSGNLESAYQKAMLASQSEVTWSLLEERPQLLMSEIQRRQRLALDSGESFVDAKQPAAKTTAPRASFLTDDSEPNFDDAPLARQQITCSSLSPLL